MENFFGENLRYLRKKKGLKLSKMADSIGFSSSQWNNWELGTSFPKFLDLMQISNYFDIKESDLIRSNLSKGNLTENREHQQKGKKGNLIGNPNGNLIPNFEQKNPKYSGEISPFSAFANLGMPHVVVADSTGKENIVHVPVKARAGYLLGYGDPTFIESLYSYNLPGLRHGTFRSFEVSGQSMKPTLLNHDWVVGQWVENFEGIRENRVHIIVTRNDGILIKRVLNRISERNKLYLKSDTITHKAEHPTIELDPSDVVEIWYARIRFSPDFSEPSEVFTRLDNMEILIQDLIKHTGLNHLKPLV